MSVNRIGSNNPINQIVSKPISKSVPTDAPKQLRAADKLELSGLTHLMKALKSTDVRTDKVSAIKAQIENGSYDESSRLDAVLDRVLDEVNK